MYDKDTENLSADMSKVKTRGHARMMKRRRSTCRTYEKLTQVENENEE